MTKLAKILLYAMLVLSVVFASWAVAVRANNLGLKDRTSSTGEKLKGRVAELGDRIKELQAARDQADGQWLAADADLRALERQQAGNRAWYADYVRTMLTGLGSQKEKVQNPVKALAYEGGQLQLDKPLVGRPVLRDPVLNEAAKQPLLAHDDYVRQCQQLWRQLQQDRDEVQKLMARNKELTEQVNGTPGKSGLRAALAEEERKRSEAEAERAFLEPLLFNKIAQLQLLEKRANTLEARLRELQGRRDAAARAVR